MSKHSRANVRHQLAQQERAAAKRTPRPKPTPLCKRCLVRGVRTPAVWALLGTVANCCDACWQEVAQRPFVRAAIIAEANDQPWRPPAPVALQRPPCKCCHQPLMSDEDWSDQTALYGRFTGLCEACFRSPQVSHDDVLRYMRTA